MSGFADSGMGQQAIGYADPLNVTGMKKGPQMAAQNGNEALGELNTQNKSLNDPMFVDAMNAYANGGSLSDVYKTPFNQAQYDQLATGSTTGSKFATDQVQSNPVLGGLYGQGGQLNQAENQLSGLYNQGFELKPEDQTLYGQASGNIARQFGQQGNQMANDLAQRGLSSSGAAGAQFSGLAGSQNEMLAKAQQNIMQQRFQNTMGQIGQYQNFVNSMGANANSTINQQYGRQLAGAQNRQSNLADEAKMTMGQNQEANSANLGAANFMQQNKPATFGDMLQGAVGQGMGAAGKGAGQSAGAAMFA